MSHVVLSIYAYWSTKEPKRLQTLLSRTDVSETATVRSSASILCGGAPVVGSGPRLRIHAGSVPGDVPPFPARSEAFVLCHDSPWPSRTAEEERGSRSGNRLAQ